MPAARDAGAGGRGGWSASALGTGDFSSLVQRLPRSQRANSSPLQLECTSPLGKASSCEPSGQDGPPASVYSTIFGLSRGSRAQAQPDLRRVDAHHIGAARSFILCSTAFRIILERVMLGPSDANSTPITRRFSRRFQRTFPRLQTISLRS